MPTDKPPRCTLPTIRMKQASWKIIQDNSSKGQNTTRKQLCSVRNKIGSLFYVAQRIHAPCIDHSGDRLISVGSRTRETFSARNIANVGYVMSGRCREGARVKRKSLPSGCKLVSSHTKACSFFITNDHIQPNSQSEV